MVSTRSLHLLPDIAPLQRVCQSVATLEAVLSPQWDFRYYLYQKNWADDRQLASMRSEAGDEWNLLFMPAGAVLKGFVPDATMAEPWNRHRRPWPGVLGELPADFAEIVADERLGRDRATFCVWRRHSDDQWNRGAIDFPSGPDPDGSEHFLFALDGDPVTYARWAEQYYEIELPFIEIRRIFMHRPMTEEMAKALNPQTDWGSLIEDLERIGYPTAAGAR